MKLSNMISALRIELQDTDQDSLVWQDSELVRGIEKSVDLMSRLIPKRSMGEATIIRSVTTETLTIASGTGTTAYKPVRPDSLTITGKVLDIDYRVDYLTGTITQIGSNLPDTDYTISYELDDGAYDISNIVEDYIRLEGVEYPAGEGTKLTFDQYGDIIIFRGSLSLTENQHIRLIWLERWTAPTQNAEGNYPVHLNNAIIIGGVGQALIYKAEKYNHDAIDLIVDIVESVADLEDNAPVIVDPIAPTPPTLGTLTPPSGYTVSKPTSPTLSSVPTAPTPPTLSFTDVEAALDKIAVELGSAARNADKYLETGETVINKSTRGAEVAANYGNYSGRKIEMAGMYANEGIARLREIEAELSKYASEVAAFGSEVNGFANETSGLIGKYREEINAETLGIQNAQADAAVFAAEVQAQNAQVNVYQSEVTAYQAQIANIQNQVNVYVALTRAIIDKATQQSQLVDKYLNISGRYLASGQAKINEFLVMLGEVKPEFLTQRASAEQRS
ncbi:MAG: hypothetical protein ACWGQW_00370 [bacterium]